MAKAKTATAKTTTRSEVAIPKLAKAATRAAFNRAVKKGSVLVYGDGELRKVDSKGNVTVVRKMATRTKIPKGFKINLDEDRIGPKTTKITVKAIKRKAAPKVSVKSKV
jgi:hypothetical protein